MNIIYLPSTAFRNRNFSVVHPVVSCSLKDSKDLEESKDQKGLKESKEFPAELGKTVFRRLIKIPASMNDEEVRKLLERELRFDKIATTVIGGLLLLITGAFGSAIWGFYGKVNALELSNAELRGAHNTIASNISDLQQKGSATAQRTGFIVDTLAARFDKFESRLVTSDSLLRLEKQLEHLEAKMDEHIKGDSVSVSKKKESK